MVWLATPKKYNDLTKLYLIKASNSDNELGDVDEPNIKVTKNLFLSVRSIISQLSFFMCFYAQSFSAPILSPELMERGYTLMKVSGISTTGALASIVGIALTKLIIIHRVRATMFAAVTLMCLVVSISMMGPSDWLHYPDDTWILIVGYISLSFFVG